MAEMKDVVTVKQILAYQSLSKYCFIDTDGWSDRIFPLPGNDDYALGFYTDEDDIESGVISLKFDSWFMDSFVASSGISGVISDPACRNKGQIRELMVAIMKRDYQKGLKMSWLYPFSFGFYGMFGYGYLGHTPVHVFKPEDIKKFKLSGEYVSYKYTPALYAKLCELNNRWAASFTGAIRWPYRDDEADGEFCKFLKRSTYLYYDIKGDLKAFIRLSLKATGEFSSTMTVHKAVWADAEGLEAVMHFLWRHRSQVSDIRWAVPASVPVAQFMIEPRVTRNDEAFWMGRPLDVASILEKKLQHSPLSSRQVISLTDPVIEENTGTWVMEGDRLEKISLTGDNPIAFNLFSSLLLGGISADQAVLSGQLPPDFPEDLRRFFTASDAICVTEDF